MNSQPQGGMLKLQHLIDSSTDNRTKLVKQYMTEEMRSLLKLDRTNQDSAVSYKTSTDLQSERTNCILHTYDQCESIRRISVILAAYNIIIKKDLIAEISLTDVLTFENDNFIYTEDQINDDFIHIKDHIEQNNTNEKEIRMIFRDKFGHTLYGNRSRRGSFREMNESKVANNEFPNVVLQQTCDKMLYYLTFNANQTNINTKCSKTYIGKKEDDKWWNYDKKLSDQMIYAHLVTNAGIFRWQSYHGFNSNQHQGLMHLKPKYEHIKEEILQNEYYCLSNDNWNQTLRKARVFYNSFARHRIKTITDGKYDDKITQKRCVWKGGETINIGELVIFKLYTDFEKLQYELKKCFRFETTFDIFALKDGQCLLQNMNKNDEKNRVLLENRLQTFYQWRIGLLTVLKKFARPLNPNIPLYHGVNSKMIINNGRLSRFEGPLSTSISYHVAQTFATYKGMVLEITTQFPRLKLCTAFDVSLISDYPEEKEQLIAFVYMRIKNVLTRALKHKKYNSFSDIDKDNMMGIPLSSKTRSIFLALHLFQQQIFSMDIQLEYWLSSFLYLHCNYNEADDNKDNNCIKNTKFAEFLKDISKENRYNHILSILKEKFEHFRKNPNQNEIIKISQISANLKPYFMDYIGLNIHQKEQYAISFEKIVKIFENAVEIHFVDLYKVDNAMLDHLIQYLYTKNVANKLKMVKFLYYDCEASNSAVLFQKNNLNQRSLARLHHLNWNISTKNVGKIGFEIRLYSNCDKLKARFKICNSVHESFLNLDYLEYNLKKTQTKCGLYKDQYSTVSVPWTLPYTLLGRINKFILHPYSYIIKSYAWKKKHFLLNGDHEIQILNLGVCDKTTDEQLYVVSQPYSHQNFKYQIIPKIFTSSDISSQYDIQEFELPISWKLCASESHAELLVNNRQNMINTINNTKWNKENVIVIYNKNENKSRLRYDVETDLFRQQLSQFFTQNDDQKLIKIIMPDQNGKDHHVEFVQIVRITIIKNKCNIDFDIGISYRYNEEKNAIKPVGIHLDKYFLINQHHLITKYHLCDCFCNFKQTPIDYLTIGNPNKDKDNLRKFKQNHV